MSLARLLAFVFAVAFATQATGVLEVFAPAGDACCPQPCPGDDADDERCPPACATCVFAKVFPSRMAARIDASLAIADMPALVVAVTGDAREGVRDDVFHPPRA